MAQQPQRSNSSIEEQQHDSSDSVPWHADPLTCAINITSLYYQHLLNAPTRLRSWFDEKAVLSRHDNEEQPTITGGPNITTYFLCNLTIPSPHRIVAEHIEVLDAPPEVVAAEEAAHALPQATTKAGRRQNAIAVNEAVTDRNSLRFKIYCVQIPREFESVQAALDAEDAAGEEHVSYFEHTIVMRRYHPSQKKPQGRQCWRIMRDTTVGVDSNIGHEGIQQLLQAEGIGAGGGAAGAPPPRPAGGDWFEMGMDDGDDEGDAQAAEEWAEAARQMREQNEREAAIRAAGGSGGVAASSPGVGLEGSANVPGGLLDDSSNNIPASSADASTSSAGGGGGLYARRAAPPSYEEALDHISPNSPGTNPAFPEDAANSGADEEDNQQAAAASGGAASGGSASCAADNNNQNDDDTAPAAGGGGDHSSAAQQQDPAAEKPKVFSYAAALLGRDHKPAQEGDAAASTAGGKKAGGKKDGGRRGSGQAAGGGAAAAAAAALAAATMPDLSEAGNRSRRERAAANSNITPSRSPARSNAETPRSHISDTESQQSGAAGGRGGGGRGRPSAFAGVAAPGTGGGAGGGTTTSTADAAEATSATPSEPAVPAAPRVNPWAAGGAAAALRAAAAANPAPVGNKAAVAVIAATPALPAAKPGAKRGGKDADDAEHGGEGGRRGGRQQRAGAGAAASADEQGGDGSRTPRRDANSNLASMVTHFDLYIRGLSEATSESDVYEALKSYGVQRGPIKVESRPSTRDASMRTFAFAHLPATASEEEKNRTVDAITAARVRVRNQVIQVTRAKDKAIFARQ